MVASKVLEERMVEVRRTIGQQYVEGKFEHEETEHVRLAYETIGKITEELFSKIPYEVIFTDDDPYTSAKHMREEVQRTGKVYIYRGWSGHPFLTEAQNVKGRAVHDVFAHLVCGCPFSFQGEYNAYLEQRKYYPEWTWRVLFAEIPAQTCAYYFKGDFSYDQRAIEAPQEWLDACKFLERDYSANSILKGLYE